MISPLPKRSLFNWIVCWQTAHRHEGTEDQHFRCSLSLDAKTWTTHLEIPLRETGIVWSPVLFLLKETLYLFYSESETCLRPAREDAMGRQFPPRWSPGETSNTSNPSMGLLGRNPGQSRNLAPPPPPPPSKKNLAMLSTSRGPSHPNNSPDH